MNKKLYMAIPPGAIIPDALPDFKIYIITPQGKYVLWAMEGKRVTQQQLARLSENGLKEVFVNLDEKFKYEQYLETNLRNILENPSTPDDQKTEVFSRVSTNVVKSAFETSFGLGAMCEASILRTQQLVVNSMVFIKDAKSLPALARMIGHDYQTYEHATKVFWLTVAFLRLAPDILEQIHPGYQALDESGRMDILGQCGVAALLHDIGKAFIPSEILTKNGPLNEIEWEIMKRHPLEGLAMLLDTDIPIFVKKAILQHHEDFYGGGYPMNLEGANITILARVLRITDAFDAMTSRRPYKEPLTPMKAVKIMVGMPEGEDENKHRDKDENKDTNGDKPQDKRDRGMRRCFDIDVLQKFIVFLGNMQPNP